jgi:hypothetical protein
MRISLWKGPFSAAVLRGFIPPQISLRIALALLLLSAAGCTAYPNRRGLGATLDPVSVQNASSNTTVILDALAQDARVDTTFPPNWYFVTEAGFNYIDDQCRSYFTELFFLNRERERDKAALLAGSAASAAILGLTGASKVTLGIVAQAFNLGGTAADLIAGTYLYQLPPATTLGFVKELQTAYREGALARRPAINSAPAAYHAIQDYLALCLPPTIEAKIAEHISTARVVPDLGTGASIGLTVASAPPVTRSEIRRAVGESVATGPLPGPSSAVRPSPPPTPSPLSGTRNDTERAISRADWRAFKAALCVTGPEARSDVIGPETREGIQEFLAGYAWHRVDSGQDEIAARTLPRFRAAARQFPACSGAVKSAYEVGVFTRPAPGEVEVTLQRAVAANALSVQPFSIRAAIRALSRKYGPKETEELDDELWMRIQQDGRAGRGDSPSFLPGTSTAPGGSPATSTR